MAGGGPAMARACVLLLLVSAYCAWAFVPPPPRRLAAPAVQGLGWGSTASSVALGSQRKGSKKQRRGRRFGWRNILGHGGRGGSGSDGGGGGGAGGGDGDSFGWSKGGSGDDGEGDDGVALSPDVAAVLGDAGKRLAELPGAVQKALVGGDMTSAVLERYLELERQGGVLGWFLNLGLFRDRLLMDNRLLEKLGIEMAVGGAAQMAAEWDRRRGKLWQELDFAFADVLTCLVCNFAAVLIAAPAVGTTVSAVGASPSAAAAAASRHVIPANAFQVVPPGGQPYRLVDRVLSPFLKVPALFTVGLVGSLLGYGTTHALATARTRLTAAGPGPAAKKGKEKEKELSVLKTSLAVGAYLAVSTNVRYQLVSGVVEDRVIKRCLAGGTAAANLASIGIRSCNTYIGSAMMIDFLKLVGLQG